MANLTQQEFLAIADLYPGGINIWCTDSVPIRVFGVTVPFIDNETNNIENTLEQAQTITLPVDNDPGSAVELQIISRVIKGVVPFKYYFYITVPKDITPYVTFTPTENEVIQGSRVVLLPNLRGGSFYTSDYNVTLNTVQNSRPSTYIVSSTSISFADIQDSLYSDTGWINARYEGTTTNNETYSSIDSAIIGSSIQGTYYPIQTPDTEINNIDASERTYLEYFHTSPQTYPSHSIETPALFELDGSHSATTSSLTVTPLLENRPLKIYQPGDLLIKTGGQEVMKVLDMYRLTAANDYRLKVVRGWNNTTKEVLNNSDRLNKLNSIRIFELEGNKPSPVKQGKIRLKDTGYIVYTDLLGYTISGSTAPVL